MIQPAAEDLAPFEGYTVSDFVTWLRVGLEGYLLEGKNNWAFEHISLFIGQDEHLVLDLRGIHNAFSADQRAKLRRAIANLLGTLEATDRHIPIFETLLLLACAVQATEILSILPTRVGNGFFGKPSLPQAKTLFDEAFLAAAELSAVTSEALACVHALISSNHYIDAYAGLALTTLCRIDPTGLADHMALLRESLHNMSIEFRVDAETKRFLASKILNAVSLNVLAEQLHKLSFVESSYIDTPSDNWLADALLLGDNPLIALHIDTEIYLYRPERPSIKVLVPSPELIKIARPITPKRLPFSRRKLPVSQSKEAQLTLFEAAYVDFCTVFHQPVMLRTETVE